MPLQEYSCCGTDFSALASFYIFHICLVKMYSVINQIGIDFSTERQCGKLWYLTSHIASIMDGNIGKYCHFLVLCYWKIFNSECLTRLQCVGWFVWVWLFFFLSPVARPCCCILFCGCWVVLCLCYRCRDEDNLIVPSLCPPFLPQIAPFDAVPHHHHFPLSTQQNWIQIRELE